MTPSTQTLQPSTGLTPRQDLNVNRITMIKRQMYGRATFDLLRTRILLAA